MPAVSRPARASDLEALVAIEQDAFAADRISRRSFRRLMAAPTARVLVAGIDGSAVGYCIVLLRKDSDAARLYSIATRPGSGGQGVGRALLAAAEAASLGAGRSTLRLEVRVDNAGAIAWYERAGFRRIDMLEDYYEDGAAALRYAKTLSGRRASAA